MTRRMRHPGKAPTQDNPLEASESPHLLFSPSVRADGSILPCRIFRLKPHTPDLLPGTDRPSVWADASANNLALPAIHELARCTIVVRDLPRIVRLKPHTPDLLPATDRPSVWADASAINLALPAIHELARCAIVVRALPRILRLKPHKLPTSCSGPNRCMDSLDLPSWEETCPGYSPSSLTFSRPPAPTSCSRPTGQASGQTRYFNDELGPAGHTCRYLFDAPSS